MKCYKNPPKFDNLILIYYFIIIGIVVWFLAISTIMRFLTSHWIGTLCTSFYWFLWWPAFGKETQLALPYVKRRTHHKLLQKQVSPPPLKLNWLELLTAIFGSVVAKNISEIEFARGLGQTDCWSNAEPYFDCNEIPILNSMKNYHSDKTLNHCAIKFV